ncbi:dihydroxyacetone kinase subunit DhaL [Roseivivax isoporae]|uniref:Dihydroxyacetone kinase n=1 Tax=Roseivivax isoporae LMG 25204 TaxID=1449351 RepID=X7FD36_9RHOB|nr:dihydroxyacetone kinase subunit DhaL [Roseivivax isoporae]ETX30822.1 dihydroxyacetone kinase [Roseivivax isoporae LMG 25204]
MSDHHRKLINDPDTLIEDLIEGMVSAHPDLLHVEGGTGRAIVARNGPRDGKVGIVVGGGSGHEPAFAGYVGRGLADAAPLGNIFASPSPAQIADAGRAADGGAGVLFLFGNYTGDVMNFGMAAEDMAREGVPARCFVVTDDVASAPADRAGERRGIAGDFFVFKVAGAAADRGLDLDAVEAAAARANAATRTMGVALSACVLPQTGRPNFDLPVGQMEIGMGIHGEPGIERGPAEGADAVADRLLEPILEELRLGAGDRVAVLVNGLGSTSLLELYLLHRRVAAVLSARDVAIHRSWVGEYCTSLDMEGASVTLMRLDADLEAWLDHPCKTPALRVGEPGPQATARPRRAAARPAARTARAVDRAALKSGGDLGPAEFRAMMHAGAEAIFAERDHLCALDGAIGDGDHGITMEIGWKAVLTALGGVPADTTITGTCDVVAEAFLDAVGASAGPLYASGFRAAGEAVADRVDLDGRALARWLDGFADGIATRGQARVGEKTMLDAWRPAADAASARADSGATSRDCLEAAAAAAQAGAAATADMRSARGRSQKLGDRVLGHVDPGAASAATILAAWARSLRPSEA